MRQFLTDSNHSAFFSLSRFGSASRHPPKKKKRLLHSKKIWTSSSKFFFSIVELLGIFSKFPVSRQNIPDSFHSDLLIWCVKESHDGALSVFVDTDLLLSGNIHFFSFVWRGFEGAAFKRFEEDHDDFWVDILSSPSADRSMIFEAMTRY